MKTFNLLDHLCHPGLLSASLQSVRQSRGAPGVDGMSVYTPESPLISTLSRELASGQWQPRPVRRFTVPKPQGGHRTLGILCVRDRVVARGLQWLVNRQFSPLFLKGSYAYRPKRNARGAIQQLLKAIRGGNSFVVYLDIEDFFGQIDRSLLMSFLGAQFSSDSSLLPTIAKLLCAPIQLGRRIQLTDRGIEQGSALSPLLSNIYMHPWDVARQALGHPWVRFSDNAAIACPTETDAQRALNTAIEDLERLQLRAKANQTSINDTNLSGFDFLGHHVSIRGASPGRKSLSHLKSRLSESALRDDLKSPLQIIEARKRVLRPWLAYYTHLSGLPSADAPTLIAAVQLFQKRSDHRAAAAVLRAEIDGDIDPSFAPMLARLSQQLGLAQTDYGEPIDALKPSLDTFGSEGVEAALYSRSYSAALGQGAPDSTREPAYNVIEQLHSLFRGNAHLHGKMYRRAQGKAAYAKVAGPMTPELWKEHLRGGHTLALYPILPDSHISIAVIDIDGDPQNLGQTGLIAKRLARLAIENGHRPLLEFSGLKGFHIWFKFNSPQHTKVTFRWLKQLRGQMLPHPASVKIELIPDRASYRRGAVGPLIKLPLGQHRVSGQFSHFVDINNLQEISPDEALNDWERPLTTHTPLSASPEIETVLKQCPMLGGLVQKAQQTHHLAHLERMALLCVIAHLGSKGRAFIHQVISYCDNYNRHITQKHIDKLKPSPVSCHRLKEWLYDSPYLGRCECPSVSQHFYKTPALFALGEVANS